MKKNNHYVPKTYLKYWAKEKKIQEYSLLVPHEKIPKWKEVSISRTSSVNSLYIFFQDGQLTDEMEDFFSEEFEMYYSTLIKKINTHSLLDESDREYISKLVASQHLRTLNGFKYIQDIVKKKYPQIMEDIVKDLNDKIQNSNNLLIENVSEIKNELPIEIQFNEGNDNQSIMKVESYVGKSYWIYALKYLLNSTYKVLNDISWCIYDAPPNFFWVTSDDPVIFLNHYGNNDYDFKGGWGNKNTNIIFPLTPKKLLFAQIGSDLDTYATASYSDAILFQRYIVEHAYTKVYSDSKNHSITKMRKRVVDEQEFKLFWESVQNFHNDYVQNELPYFQNTKKRNT